MYSIERCVKGTTCTRSTTKREQRALIQRHPNRRSESPVGSIGQCYKLAKQTFVAEWHAAIVRGQKHVCDC